MRHSWKLLLATVVAALSLPIPALAHGDAETGTTVLEIGWGIEPAFAGYPNSVYVGAVHDGESRTGAKLEVVVVYGGPDGDTRTEPMRLDPIFGQPGGYQANLIPTAAGKYTFLISGQVAEDKIDVQMTSGPNTFDTVVEPTELQFPETLPNPIEQRDAITAAQDSTQQASLTAEEADQVAAEAKSLGMIGIGLGAGGLLLALLALLRSRKA